MYKIPELFNFRIIYNYDVAEILSVYETLNIFNIKNYPIIMTIEIDNYSKLNNELINDKYIDII